MFGKHGTLILFVTVLIKFNVSILKHTYKEHNCPRNNENLADLFTLMCNNVANSTNITLRDACTGCFQSATNVNGQPSVAAITACASTYLVNTNYSSCFNLPQVQPTDVTPTSTDNVIDPRSKRSLQCFMDYCGYVRCVRSVNANILISSCFNEAANVDNPLISPIQQVNFYKNITSCILARTRCSDSNPITGKQQENGRYYTMKIHDKFGKTSTKTTAYYYSLQITSSGELRVIAIPGTTSVRRDFCSNQNGLLEASWMNYVC